MYSKMQRNTNRFKNVVNTKLMESGRQRAAAPATCELQAPPNRAELGIKTKLTAMDKIKAGIMKTAENPDKATTPRVNRNTFAAKAILVMLEAICVMIALASNGVPSD